MQLNCYHRIKPPDPSPIFCDFSRLFMSPTCSLPTLPYPVSDAATVSIAETVLVFPFSCGTSNTTSCFFSKSQANGPAPWRVKNILNPSLYPFHKILGATAVAHPSSGSAFIIGGGSRLKGNARQNPVANVVQFRLSDLSFTLVTKLPQPII